MDMGQREQFQNTIFLPVHLNDHAELMQIRIKILRDVNSSHRSISQTSLLHG